MAEHAAVMPRGSRLDEWWARMLCTPARIRLWQWGGPALVVLLATVLRLWNLGSPHQLVFDETFYVKDSWTLLNNGYESQWADDPNPDFNAGSVNGYLQAGSYVVHPPLGKWIIALGLAVFGAGDAVGWRVSTAVVGILSVLLIILIARGLFRSTLLAVIAGTLLAVDGNAIVMSRVALLDNSVMFFALLAFGCVLLDRGWHHGRLAARIADARAVGGDPSWGPALWWRPWLMAAGLFCGAATAVKWSGAWFLAAFGLYVVVSDILARRRLGVHFFASAGILKQGPVSFLLTVPIALTAYVASWAGWFATAGGYYRQFAANPDAAWTGFFAWVPHSVQSLWHYHVAAYNFHVALSTPHPYQANPLGWLLMIRPTNMYYEGAATGCWSEPCVAQITGIANPLIWWGATAAIVYMTYRLIRYRHWQTALILTAFAAGYLPWLGYLNRTVFQFYTIAFEPFMLLGLTAAIGIILGTRNDPRIRRESGIRVVAIFLVAAILTSAYFYPLWTGTPVPFLFRQLHLWIPSWS